MELKRVKRKVFGGLDSIGKIPPQATDLETAVLGAILVEKDAYETIESLLRPEMFYKEPHNIIFKAITELKQAKSPIDTLTVTEQLRKGNSLELVGGAYYITVLTNGVVSAVNILAHSRIIAEKFLKREVIRIAQEYITDAFDEATDAFDVIENIKKDISDLENSIGEEATESFAKSINDEVREKKQQLKDGIRFNGISTGNPELDEKIGGFERSCLHVLGARSGGAKSARAMGFAKYAAEQGYEVGIWSIEMSQRNYVRRFIVESSSILLNKYRNNQLDDYDIRAIDFAASNLVRLPIHIFDSPKCTPNKIRKDAKAVIKRKGKLDFIIVDYLQLMRSDEKSGNREQEIGSISMELKAISKELDIPVLALAQLNKEWGKDGGAQRPKTAHLRESAGIEHSADLIMFVYRPELYFEYGSHPDEQYSRDSIGEAEYNMISELLIGKARDGQVNLKVVENFIGGFMRFTSKGQAQNQDPFITGDSEPENSDLLAPF